MSGALIDSFGRPIDYLRLSVTDRCNLRCTYCMPQDMRFAPRVELLTIHELGDLAERFAARGIRRIRLTGGEPLARKGIAALIERLGAMIGGGLDELTLTTNGLLLADHAQSLARAGVRRVNVSLDTRDPALFRQLARRDGLERVLGGLKAAREAGLAVKINTVALKGQNQFELPALIAWAHAQGHALTLIETMPMGETGADRYANYLPLDAVRRDLEARWTLIPLAERTAGPARYVRVQETRGTLGFITPLTGNFCAGCNRIRVTATGQLHACLGGESSVDLRAALRCDDARALDAALDRALAAKPERHDFAIAAGSTRGPDRAMSVTGG